MNFAGKSVIVTGASRGLGKAIAIELGRRGAMVACVARSTDNKPLALPGTVDETARAVTDAGGLGLAAPCDLTRDTQILGMFESVLERFGRLDMLVNNAAVSFPGDLDIEMKRYDVVMRVNARAPLMTSRLARSYLGRGSEGGRILNIGTSTSSAYFPDAMAFGMSKAGMEYLTISVAAILQRENIAVNCYRIDWPVATEGNLSNFPNADHSAWVDPPHGGRRGDLDARTARGLDRSHRLDAGAGRARSFHRPAGAEAARAARPLDPGHRPPQHRGAVGSCVVVRRQRWPRRSTMDPGLRRDDEQAGSQHCSTAA